MYRSQKDRKHRRTISLAAQWRKRYRNDIKAWGAKVAPTAVLDVNQEAMDKAHLMVIVHNSNDRRDKAPKHVRRKRKAAYKPYLGEVASQEYDFDDSKMGKRRPPVSPKEEKSLNNPIHW